MMQSIPIYISQKVVLVTHIMYVLVYQLNMYLQSPLTKPAFKTPTNARL